MLVGIDHSLQSVHPGLIKTPLQDDNPAWIKACLVSPPLGIVFLVGSSLWVDADDACTVLGCGHISFCWAFATD